MHNQTHPLFLSLLMLGLFVYAHTQNITIGQPPAIVEKKVYSMVDSPKDAKLIYSAKLQNLEISVSTVGGSTSTTFKMSYFNRLGTSNTISQTFTYPGSWIHVKNSQKSLSCSIVADEGNNQVGLLQFDRQAQIFKMLATTSYSTYSSNPLDPTEIDKIKLNSFVGQNCLIGNYNNGTHITAYRLSQNMTELVIIKSIQKQYLQAYTQDEIYSIYSDILYRYNRATFAYDQIKTFPPSTDYTIQNSNQRILVSACNYALNADPTYKTANYTISVFNDLPNGLLLVGTITVNNALEIASYPPMQIKISPLMTIMGFRYDASATDQRIVAKHIDFTQNIITDLAYQNPAAALQTINGMNGNNEMYFNDFFSVMRNGSKYTDNTQSYFEEGYQFVGNQIILLNRRDLKIPTTRNEFYDFKKTIIDPSNAEKLIVLDVYNTSATNYDVIEFVYGNFASTSTPSSAVTVQSGPNVGLIVGLTVGLTAAVAIIVVVVIVVCVKKSKMAPVIAKDSMGEHGHQLREQTSVAEFKNTGQTSIKGVPLQASAKF